LGQRNASGDLLSTNLGLSLASTSWVDRVDLYGLNKMAQTLAHPKQTPWLAAFDLGIMETDENRKDYKQEKFRSLLIRTPLYLTRTKREWNGERRAEAVYFSQYTRHSKRRGIGKE
jgi:hypothetical protein